MRNTDLQVPMSSVCICTRKRPEGLALLLESLTKQVDAPTFEVIVVDNDPVGSARDVAESFRNRLTLQYDIEPAPCLSTARNRSVSLARAAHLAFIDDDETAAPTWLSALHRALTLHNADAVSGPTTYLFDNDVAAAIRHCQFFMRPPIGDGDLLPWFFMTSGNAYIRRAALPDSSNPFRRQFGVTGGEDIDCFRRMVIAGRRLCAAGPDAMVYERRSVARANYRWALRRALRNGGNLADLEWSHQSRWTRLQNGMGAIGKSVRHIWRACVVHQRNSIPFVQETVKAAMQAGRFLSVAGYRYKEYRTRP